MRVGIRELASESKGGWEAEGAGEGQELGPDRPAEPTARGGHQRATWEAHAWGSCPATSAVHRRLRTRGPAIPRTHSVLIPQAFFTLARDIKAKMDKKLVSVCPSQIPEWISGIQPLSSVAVT